MAHSRTHSGARDSQNAAVILVAKGKAGIARALYIAAKEQRVVILRAFVKKTEKTPAGEIELALQGAKELKR